MRAKENKLVLTNLFFPSISNRALVLTKDTLFVFSFAVLTGIFAKLKIEIGPVPITMQTLAVLLSGAILGSKKGALSQLVYLFLGLVGVPWFSRGGGIGYILSPTFGYLLGFVFAAYIVGWLCERGWGQNLKKAILAMVFGNATLYIPAIFWLAKFFGFEKALAVGFYPFVVGDVLKLLIAAFILRLVWKFIKK